MLKHSNEKLDAMPTRLDGVQMVFDWRIFYSTTGGNLRFVKEVYARLVRNHGARLYAMVRARKNKVPKEIPIESWGLGFPIRWLPESPLKNFFWKRKLERLRCPIFHSAYYNLPPTENCLVIATFHDLIPELFPHLFSDQNDLVHIQRKKLTVRKSDCFVCISQSTKSDLEKVYHVPSELIEVVPHGVDYRFFSTPSHFSNQVRLPENYILIVGGRERHKNFLSFLKCYVDLRLYKDFFVVVCGELWAPWELDFISRYGLEKYFIHFFKPDDECLRDLYQRCSVFVFPSLYEGFGIPTLEAMACGAPLAISDIPAFREVAGEAAHYFEPLSLESMGRAIYQAASEGRDSQKVNLGRKRAGTFSWENSAEIFSQVILKVFQKGCS